MERRLPSNPLTLCGLVRQQVYGCSERCRPSRACWQVLRIERESEEVTVFYRPNTMHAEELSRNPVANALAVTFLMVSEQVLGVPSHSPRSAWRVALLLDPWHPCLCVGL